MNGVSLRFRLREPENAHFREGNRQEPSAINSLDQQWPGEEQALAATREHSGLRQTLWSGLSARQRFATCRSHRRWPDRRCRVRP
jgi:hypothetical protein